MVRTLQRAGVLQSPIRSSYARVRNGRAVVADVPSPTIVGRQDAGPIAGAIPVIRGIRAQQDNTCLVSGAVLGIIGIGTADTKQRGIIFATVICDCVVCGGRVDASDCVIYCECIVPAQTGPTVRAVCPVDRDRGRAAVVARIRCLRVTGRAFGSVQARVAGLGVDVWRQQIFLSAAIVGRPGLHRRRPVRLDTDFILSAVAGRLRVGCRAAFHCLPGIVGGTGPSRHALAATG